MHDQKPTLARIRERRADLERVVQQYGASNLRVFGSVARQESDSLSDIDILVDVTADVHGFAYFGLLEDLRRALEDALGGTSVDVVDAAGLQGMRERVLAEAVPL